MGLNDYNQQAMQRQFQEDQVSEYSQKTYSNFNNQDEDVDFQNDYDNKSNENNFNKMVGTKKSFNMAPASLFKPNHRRSVLIKQTNQPTPYNYTKLMRTDTLKTNHE